MFRKYIMTNLEHPIISNKAEDILLFKLNKKLGCNLTKTTKYCRYDGIDIKRKILVECKNRSNTKNHYPTTILPADKIKYWQKKFKDYDYYVLLKFIDGCYYYKWASGTGLTLAQGGRCDRGKEEYKQYWYIPIDQLISLGD